MMQPSPMTSLPARAGMVIGSNIALTILTASIAGPAAWKLQELFGLVGWAARAPFYLLPLYLAPLVLWIRPSIAGGVAIGFSLAVPLVLWSVATECPPVVPIAYMVSGIVQGAFVTWLARGGTSRQKAISGAA